MSYKHKIMNENTVGSGNNLVDFGEAIKALKQGKRVRRTDWDGQFIFMQVPSEVPAEIVPKMSSLPKSVKDEFQRRKEVGWGGLKFEGGIGYSNQVALVSGRNEITSWFANPSDFLSEDWLVLD